VLDRRAESSPQVAAAGMVINTMGWIEGPGYDLLVYCIKALQVRGSTQDTVQQYRVVACLGSVHNFANPGAFELWPSCICLPLLLLVLLLCTAFASGVASDVASDGGANTDVCNFCAAGCSR
jgi:hypothetical protein